MLEESNRPEDDGKPQARLDDANPGHALVESRTESDWKEEEYYKDNEEDTAVMAPQDCAVPPTIGPESKHLTIGEYRDLAFKGLTETAICENDGEVYDIKKNQFIPTV